MHVVSRVKGIGQNDDNIVLDHLTTDQVHLFARNWCPKPGFEKQVHLSLGNCITLRTSINSQVLVCLPLHRQTNQQQTFAGLSMSSLASNS